MGEKAPAYGVLDEIGARLVQVDRPVISWNVTSDNSAFCINDAQSFEVDGAHVVYDWKQFRGEVKHAALEALMQSATTNVRSTFVTNNAKPVLALFFRDSTSKLDQFTDLEIGLAEKEEVVATDRRWRRTYNGLKWKTMFYGSLLGASFLVFLFLWIFGPPSGYVETHWLGNAAVNVAADVIGAIAAVKNVV